MNKWRPLPELIDWPVGGRQGERQGGRQGGKGN